MRLTGDCRVSLWENCGIYYYLSLFFTIYSKFITIDPQFIQKNQEKGVVCPCQPDCVR
jgi:hypothetical protein